jgi:hypothetical protein
MKGIFSDVKAEVYGPEGEKEKCKGLREGAGEIILSPVKQIMTGS